MKEAKKASASASAFQRRQVLGAIVGAWMRCVEVDDQQNYTYGASKALEDVANSLGLPLGKALEKETGMVEIRWGGKRIGNVQKRFSGIVAVAPGILQSIQPLVRESVGVIAKRVTGSKVVPDNGTWLYLSDERMGKLREIVSRMEATLHGEDEDGAPSRKGKGRKGK